MAEIVKVTYETGDGTIWPLQMDKLIRIKTANFHNWTFEPDLLLRKYGGRVLRFRKEPAAYLTTLYFGGSIADRKTRIDEFHSDIERDVRNLTPGKLTWGDYYIDCYIRSSSTYPDERNNYTVNDIEIYCPYPFWIEPAIYNFRPDDSSESEGQWLDYRYGYSYDYTSKPAGSGYVWNNAPGAANFRLTFYGPAINPYIFINSVKYMVYASLGDGERLVIDSMERKVVRYLPGGLELNAFNEREKSETSIYEPVPMGRSEVIRPADIKIDLLIYQERSEPAWT